MSHNLTSMAKSKAKDPAASDPDKLVRQAAGSYRTADDRFEVREAGIGWYLVDTTQQNELGQELMHGPYATLKEVRTALPGARSSKVTPIRPPKAARASGSTGERARGGSSRAAAAKPEGAPQPAPSWIDKLPDAEATEVRRLIRALERADVPDAERLVRRDREGLGPAVVEELLSRELASLLESLPEAERGDARKLVDRVVELLTVDGTRRRGDLPGWALVEIGRDGEPPNRRITIR